jgi:2-polyprenyl-6-methoxyphenol hydroxylase-like FAD-dependent oxidoreductase
MIRGSGAAFGYTFSPGGEAFWFARVSGPPASAEEIAATTPDQWRDQLVPLLRPDSTPAADIVEATSGRLMVTNACDLPIGIAWRTPRALIVGDAAHAASPATGQGASMALEDAVVLAKGLRDAPSMSAGLIAYERSRRSRVEHNILASAELTAGRRPSPQGAPAPDDELFRQLDWATPLPV